MPICPDLTYKGKGWVNWGDFLGTNSVANKHRKFLSYEEAKNLARKSLVNNSKDWKALARTQGRQLNIPVNPDIIYKNRGWSGWKDFLGTTGRIKFKSFDEAKKIHSMYSSEGEEVAFLQEIDAMATRGAVEQWLIQVEEMMIASIKDTIEKSFEAYPKMKRNEWVLNR